VKVLVACEFSGIVREAFRKRGHDAWSCDLLPTEIPGNHIQGDVLGILDDGWDLMITHPPCTYLASAGLHYLQDNPERQAKLEDAFQFILSLWESPIKQICIENPIGRLNTTWFAPSQTIQPFYFGDNERKATCLWLKHLPILMYTHILPNPKPTVNARDRSRTFPGIANAMAEQWGGDV